MISIKLNTYNTEDLQALFDILGESLTMIEYVYCPQNNGAPILCTQCKYKNVCYDIKHNYEYIGRKLIELENQNNV